MIISKKKGQMRVPGVYSSCQMYQVLSSRYCKQQNRCALPAQTLRHTLFDFIVSVIVLVRYPICSSVTVRSSSLL